MKPLQTTDTELLQRIIDKQAGDIDIYETAISALKITPRELRNELIEAEYNAENNPNFDAAAFIEGLIILASKALGEPTDDTD